MVITQELKEALIEEINNDAAFGYDLFRAIMSSAGDRIVTTTYLNQALAKQTREFDERLSQQEGRFDQKLDALKEELKQFIDAKLGYIGARWGEDIENTYRNFAETIITQWGGTATKWKRTVTAKDEEGRVFKFPYEIDVVVADGKTLLIECKSKCDLDDIERFLDNVQQYEQLETPAQPVEKAMLTFFITTPARKKAEAERIILIMPE